MTLQDLASGARQVALPAIGGDEQLSREIQTRLSELGVLDPPADGRFGPVSHWALGQFLKRVDLAAKTTFDAAVARALLAAKANQLFPLKAAKTFAGKLVRALQIHGHWIGRHPDCVNIVYVEGMDPDGKRNVNTPNEFNDIRVVVKINRNGSPAIVDEWEATTEPGRFFTVGPETNAQGAARIAFGQYKSWSVGIHRAGTPGAHEALVQTAPIDILRDLDRNFRREGDRKFTGVFGINQHRAADLSRTDIGRASAGCLVGRTRAGHAAFMTLCKTDPRFLANNGYRFVTSVLPAAEV